MAEVAKLMMDAGLIVMIAFISPFRAERQMARELIGEDNFIEVFVGTPLEVCEQRDPKGQTFCACCSPSRPTAPPMPWWQRGRRGADGSIAKNSSSRSIRHWLPVHSSRDFFALKPTSPGNDASFD